MVSSIPHRLSNLLWCQTNILIDSSSTCINRTAAYDRLADRLHYGRQMVLGVIRQANALSLYSFNNEREKSQLAVGYLNPTLIY